jgi:hypothetical protein
MLCLCIAATDFINYMYVLQLFKTIKNSNYHSVVCRRKQLMNLHFLFIYNDICILYEGINCQFYPETFILLPVSEGYTNVPRTSSQMLPPHLTEPIPPEEHNQMTCVEQHTYRTLAASQTVVRRSSHVNQQLRDLLEAMSTDGSMTNQTT